MKMTEKKLFGTDGIRGIANVYPMTGEIAFKLGQALVKVFDKKWRKHRVLIGKDTRLSGYMIEYALTAGICSMGGQVLLVGPIPTPAIAHLTKSMCADVGVVISASHNPAEHNGLKLFSGKGVKVDDDILLEIENIILNNNIDTSEIIGNLVGNAFRIDNAKGRYIEYVKSTIKNTNLNNIKIVLDCANGAAYKVAPLIFKELGADMIIINNNPDGLNINENCGSLFPQNIAKKVIETGANIGIALDGDADRIIVIDENGEILDGDELLAICANYLMQKGKLKNNAIVATVMSNVGLNIAMKNIGVKVVRTKVGDHYVSEAMQKGNYILGGENSGHIIFGKYMLTGDGIIAGLQLLQIMKEKEQKLSQLKKIITKYPQVLINVEVKEKKPLNQLTEVIKLVNLIKQKLGDEGRILIRYSGTENKCRVMIEGKDQDVINVYAKQVVAEVEKEIGI